MATGSRDDVLETLRRRLLAVLVLALVGIGADLLLIGHVEEALQLVPLVTIGLGALVSLWLAVRPSRVALRTFRWVMALFVVSGVVGVYLHLQGNAAFELEMRPALGFAELARRAATGATPALAPGSIVPLGLIGFVLTYRHPAGAVATTARD